MNWVNYKPIQTMKKTEKAVVLFAALDGYEQPLIVKRLFEANKDVYFALAKWNNIHIPSVYHVEECENELIVFEEYINGITLDEYIKGEKADVVNLLELILQLCEVLEVLHANQPPIIHRDIKPSNILIDTNGILKLIDFDASRFYRKEKTTSDTILLGTIEYAAPEQFGYAQTDARSDIYSVGVMCNELKMVQNSSIGRRWKRLVGKCTSFDPEKRYKNATCLKRDLKRCIWYAKHPLLGNMIQKVLPGVVLLVILFVGIGVATEGNRAVELQGISASGPTPEPVSEENGVLLKENVVYWNSEADREVVLEVRSDVIGRLQAVYVCMYEEEFSEILLPLEETLYVLSADGREVHVEAAALTEEDGTEPWNLFIELEDGRGEKVWIHRMETKQ